MYNWYAVNDPRGLGPKGWHVPKDAEWNVLINSLNMDNKYSANGKMKEVGFTHWDTTKYSTATNNSGFSGLPGGTREKDGIFGGIGKLGAWWSSTEGNAELAWWRLLYYELSEVKRGYYYKTGGYSVRLIKD